MINKEDGDRAANLINSMIVAIYMRKDTSCRAEGSSEAEYLQRWDQNYEEARDALRALGIPVIG